MGLPKQLRFIIFFLINSWAKDRKRHQKTNWYQYLILFIEWQVMCDVAQVMWIVEVTSEERVLWITWQVKYKNHVTSVTMATNSFGVLVEGDSCEKLMLREMFCEFSWERELFFLSRDVTSLIWLLCTG